MKKFFAFAKTRLTNGQHFTFVKAFVEVTGKIADAPAKMKAAIDALKAAQAEEDRFFKVERGSRLTEKICEADVLRDSSYRKLCGLVKVWAGSGMEPQAAAAKALNRVLNTYRIRTKAQLDEESGLMASLLTDLSTAEMQADISVLGVENLVADMKQGNGQVITLLKQRDEENAARVRGALRRARLNSDRAYAEVIDAIEAFNYTMGGYDDIINKWNATIDHYRNVLNRKSGRTKTGRPTGDDDGTGSDAEGDKPDTPAPDRGDSNDDFVG